MDAPSPALPLDGESRGGVDLEIWYVPGACNAVAPVLRQAPSRGPRGGGAWQADQ